MCFSMLSNNFWLIFAPHRICVECAMLAHQLYMDEMACLQLYMHFLPGVCIAFRRKIYGPYIFNGAKERNILVCPLNLYLCAMCASIGNGAWKNRLDKGEKAISFCSLCLSYRLHSMQCAALPLSHAANLFRFHAQGERRETLNTMKLFALQFKCITCSPYFI